MQSSHYYTATVNFVTGIGLSLHFLQRPISVFFENSKVSNYKNSLNSDQKLHVFEII